MRTVLRLSFLFLFCLPLVIGISDVTHAQQNSRSSGEQNVAAQGIIIASVVNPTGTGNRSLEVIRDGIKPQKGSSDSSQQYDSFDGNHSAAGTEYYGYTFNNTYTFTRLVFQEGKHFWDGGWWANGSLRVQVRQNGNWGDVPANPDPVYPKGDSQATFGPSYETYTFNLNNIQGDGIRIIGTNGGSNHFISIGELEVWAITGGTNPTLSLEGTWDSNIGLVYAITQNDNQFSWYVEKTRESGTGTITGTAIQASWSGSVSRGSATGSISRTDAAGMPTEIKWNNGVVFNRRVVAVSNLFVKKACLVGLYNKWTDCDTGQSSESASLIPGIGTLFVTEGGKSVTLALAGGAGDYTVEVILSNGAKVRVALVGPDAQNVRMLDDGKRMGWRIMGNRLVLP
ncbi:MAG: hypothetical protein CSYNP_02427 [Syntrophus sp. SKADARSKE-3]|nr:hypothetical protein [Syntrophus sp. SKADARSKE-3]